MWPSELGVFDIRIIHEILFPGILSWAPGCGAFSFPEILPGGRRPVSVWECEYVKQFFPVLGRSSKGCLLQAWAGRHSRKLTENWGFVCFNEHPGIFRSWAPLAFLKDTREVWMSLTLVPAYLSEVWESCAYQGRGAGAGSEGAPLHCAWLGVTAAG